MLHTGSLVWTHSKCINKKHVKATTVHISIRCKYTTVNKSRKYMYSIVSTSIRCRSGSIRSLEIFFYLHEYHPFMLDTGTQEL